MIDKEKNNVLAVRWHGINDLRLDTIPIPKLDNDMVLVKNKITGICGTDKHTLHDGTFVDSSKNSINYPAILGHESSGEIIAVGKNVKTDLVGQNIKPGDSVIFFELLGCGECKYCRQEKWNVCRDYKGAALKPGTLVEYYTYRNTQLIKFEGLSYEEAAIVEPCSCALHSTRLADPKIRDTVVIIGAGCIGLLRLQIVKNSGVTKIIVIENNEKRMKLAKELGADIVINSNEKNIENTILEETYERYGADIVFEDAGLAVTQELALKLAKPHGIVMLSGISPKPASIDIFKYIQLKELTVLGAIGTGDLPDRRNDYQVSIDLIKNKKVNVKPIISNIFDIKEYKKAFSFADDGLNAIKVMIRTNSN